MANAGPEGYELIVTKERVSITASQAAGLFYGVQSLRQLLPAFLEWRGLLPGKGGPVTAPPVRIVDTPRYEWRGAMLDVARHFLGVEDVKRFIDYIALYKLNRLHLHLSDDQGWRIEIKSWPKLATHGGSTAVGGGAGGYYTQEQYKDIVAYAAQRFVAVVPEIDLPTPHQRGTGLLSRAELRREDAAPLHGHRGRVQHDLPRQGGHLQVHRRRVQGDLAALTPTPWLHLGGDEVKTITDEQYVKFVERVQGIVTKHGKTVVGWDEISATDAGPGRHRAALAADRTCRSVPCRRARR